MSWQSQREEWNRNGRCARKACQGSLVHRNRIKAGQHRDNRLYYCIRCTRLVNDYNPLPDGEVLIDFVPRGETDLPFSHLLMAGKTCSKPCPQCPFKRKSLPGWLGSYSGPEEFLETHFKNEVVNPCHMTVDYEDADWNHNLEEAPRCAGQAIMFRNHIKEPRNPDISIELDLSSDIFSFPAEFIRHHSRHCDYEIKTDGKTVWVNGEDGMCLGRFSQFGVDVHRTAAEQMAGMNQCLDCSKTPYWERFVSMMQLHHGILVDDTHRPSWLD